MRARSPPLRTTEPGFEDGRDEEGAAEAARLAAAEAAVAEELVRARESACGLKEALGKRLPVDGEVATWWSSPCCLAASAPDFGVISLCWSVSVWTTCGDIEVVDHAVEEKEWAAWDDSCARWPPRRQEEPISG